MKLIRGIEINDFSKEELLPDFSPDFPYIASRAELDRYLTPAMGIPWHWHRTVELFYVESGSVEYTTPHGKWLFPAGSGGLLNANVLHCSDIKSSDPPNIQLLHLFDPSFLSGGHGTRLDTKYILPMTSASGLEVIALYPEIPTHRPLLEKILAAFDIPDEEWGYEFRLREALTEIWLELFALAGPSMSDSPQSTRSDALMKSLILYVHQYYAQPISIEALAAHVHISKRACFRVFQENLHITPLEYIREYRLQRARLLLIDTDTPVTQIASCCGLGSSSYFGSVFRQRFGCSPVQFRKSWQDSDTIRRKSDI